jgi:hypothetical protein
MALFTGLTRGLQSFNTLLIIKELNCGVTIDLAAHIGI